MRYSDKLRKAADVIDQLGVEPISVSIDRKNTRVLLRDSQKEFANRFGKYERRSSAAAVVYEAEVDGVTFTGNEPFKVTTEEVVIG